MRGILQLAIVIFGLWALLGRPPALMRATVLLFGCAFAIAAFRDWVVTRRDARDACSQIVDLHERELCRRRRMQDSIGELPGRLCRLALAFPTIGKIPADWFCPVVTRPFTQEGGGTHSSGAVPSQP